MKKEEAVQIHLDSLFGTKDGLFSHAHDGRQFVQCDLFLFINNRLTAETQESASLGRRHLVNNFQYPALEVL